MAQTISYNLDSLGWMQFESLIQVLLKAELGLGLDYGAAAPITGRTRIVHELNFPSPTFDQPRAFCLSS